MLFTDFSSGSLKNHKTTLFSGSIIMQMSKSSAYYITYTFLQLIYVQISSLANMCAGICLGAVIWLCFPETLRAA